MSSAARLPAAPPRARLGSRIALRIFLFNALLVFLPAGAFLLLDSYERSLVDALEQSLAQQARIVAAWLGQSPLDAVSARRAIEAIGERRTARYRVVDSGGRLLADSSGPESSGSATETRSTPGAAPADEGLRAGAAGDESLLYGLFSLPARVWRRALAPPAPPIASADFYGSAGRLGGSEIAAALAGRYGAATRVSSGGQVSVTLYSAVPVERGGATVGAVLLSQSTYRILRDLYAIRTDIARVFAWSLAAAAALSALLALTIVGPVARLRAAAAAALDAPSGAAEAFPLPRSRDEIGDLGRALRGLLRRLDARQRDTERFAADAAHEFRNPLAAIRSSAELAEGSSLGSDRSRFHRAILDEVDRLRALVEGLRTLSAAEGGEPGSAASELDLAAATRAALERASVARAGEGSLPARGGGPLRLEIESSLPAGSGPRMEGARLDAILDNLAENAASFASTLARAAIRREGGTLVLEMEDDGPGIPPEHLERVFDRFFTWRPGGERGAHTGLGLPLARALAEAEGGSLEASARPGGGARLTLRLPASAPARRDNTPPTP